MTQPPTTHRARAYAPTNGHDTACEESQGGGHEDGK